MPEIGEIKRADEVGKGIGWMNPGSQYIWSACPDCGQERWIPFRKKGGHPYSPFCNSCNKRGSRNSQWIGGRRRAQGYIFICLSPSDFFYSMADKKGCVLEHRLVMAKLLGRNLHSWEIVHHKNHIRDDNRIENLQLVTDDRHKQITILEMKIDKLLDGQRELKAEIRLLRLENKRLSVNTVTRLI